MFLIAIIFILIPVSLLLWIANIFSYIFTNYEDTWKPVSPMRWILAFLIPMVMVKYGLKKKSLDGSGASMAFLVGFVLTMSNYCFMASMIAFFLSGSRATKFRSRIKQSLENDFKEGGQRNWIQVLCNGGVATEAAILFMIDAGCGEVLIDFSRHYMRSWLALAVLGAICCCSGDTLSSEIGSVMGGSQPMLITSLRRVPKGTNGAVSLVGLLVSVLGGVIISSAYYSMLVLTAHTDAITASPPQWPVVVVGAAAGLLGSVVDSVLGATLQYSGYDMERKCIVETPGDYVEHISGSPILDNHSVNLLSSLITAIITPYMAFNMWPYFT